MYIAAIENNQQNFHKTLHDEKVYVCSNAPAWSEHDGFQLCTEQKSQRETNTM